MWRHESFRVDCGLLGDSVDKLEQYSVEGVERAFLALGEKVMAGKDVRMSERALNLFWRMVIDWLSRARV
jgi:hypothetical protein